MNSSERENLLEDVLRDHNYAAFRAEVYEGARDEFRKRHLKTRTWTSLALAASVVAMAMLWLPRERGDQAKTDPGVPASGHSRMEGVELVSSMPLEAASVVRSVVNRQLSVDTARTGRLEVVQSRTQPVSELSDTELVGLFPNEARGFFFSGGVREFVVLARK